MGDSIPKASTSNIKLVFESLRVQGLYMIITVSMPDGRGNNRRERNIHQIVPNFVKHTKIS